MDSNTVVDGKDDGAAEEPARSRLVEDQARAIQVVIHGTCRLSKAFICVGMGIVWR